MISHPWFHFLLYIAIIFNNCYHETRFKGITELVIKAKENGYETFQN